MNQNNSYPDRAHASGRPTYVSEVDPFIGTEPVELPEPAGIAAKWWMAKPVIGNTHPGACRPFGMVSACPYSGAYVTGYGRYTLSLDGLPDRPTPIFDHRTALGVSHFHHSGTGRIRAYYNYFLVTPYVGAFAGGLDKRYDLNAERSRPGYYAAQFDPEGIGVELTVSERAAYHRYTFPEGEGERGLRIDLGRGGLGIEGMRTAPSGGKVRLSGDGEATGWCDMDGILIQFRAVATGADGTPCTARLWEHESPTDQESMVVPAGGGSLGVVFEPCGSAGPAGQQQICLSLTFSLRSAEQLQANAVREISPAGFDSVCEDSEWEWECRLGRVRVDGGTAEQRKVFYTALYHSLLKPADCYNENPFRDADGPIFFDLATMWDIYRTQLPLMFTFYRNRAANLINALLDIAEREGNFPISYLMERAPERFGRQASALGHVAIADAYEHGIRGVDWRRALRLMARSISKDVRREFVTEGVVRPISHTLDLAFASFVTAKMAIELGEDETAKTFMKRAAFWRNAYLPETGMLHEDSTFYEGGMWNYAFRLMHDMEGRIGLFEDKAEYLRHLDLFFGFEEPTPDWRGSHFEGLNNEPDFETPYAYIYAGRHDRTADVVRTAMDSMFGTTQGGLAGNDDSGALSSWFVWSAIGLFPVAGQGILLIGTPLFERASLRLSRLFQVRAQRECPEHRYVVAARLNGNELRRAYITYDELAAGGVLDLELAAEPNGWASEADQRPPSFPDFASIAIQ